MATSMILDEALIDRVFTILREHCPEMFPLTPHERDLAVSVLGVTAGVTQMKLLGLLSSFSSELDELS